MPDRRNTQGISLSAQRATGNREKRSLLPLLGFAAAILAFVVSAVTIFFLANTIRQEIDAIATANSDTTQWSLSQIEVDLLALQVAAGAVRPEAPGTLRELRKRFDIFYSRMGTIVESSQFRDLRENPVAQDSLGEMRDFFDRFTARFDGEDAGLLAAMPDLIGELQTLRAPIRDFSLLGVRLFASVSDDRRETIAGLLTRIAVMTLALVISLLVVVFVLFGLFRQSAKAESAAEDARRRMQKVISTSIDSILAVDIDGRIIDYNGAAERVFGYSREEAIGQEMAKLIIPEHLRDAHTSGMERYRATGERRVVGKGLVRLDARRKNGTIFPVEMAISSVETNGQEIFVSFLRDISERVAAERELIDARDKAVAGEKAKAEMLAVMSHEIRTPLNGLVGTMDLLRDTPLERTQRRYLAAMDTSAILLKSHVNSVLEISRADAGLLDLNFARVDPTELMDELVESQRTALQSHGNTVSVEFGNAPRRVWVDPLRLRQVVLNLLGNANKFTRNGEISIEIDHAGDDMMEIRVADTGIGIAEENQQHIFEDFKTMDSSYGRTTEGTGLGLGIARRLVIAMGGTIGVESEFGEGSLFWVRLPIGASIAGEPHPAETGARSDRARPGPYHLPGDTGRRAQGGAARKLDILLVEDNEINRMIAREMLAKEGHRVAEAHDGREGVHLAGMSRFDLILMDISMPVMDGVSAAKEIRGNNGHNRDTPIVALTAHTLPEDIERFRAAGISDTLIKPLSRAALTQSLALHTTTSAAVAPDSDPDSDADTDHGISQVLDFLADQFGPDQARAMARKFEAEGERVRAAIAYQSDGTHSRKALADLVHHLVGSASVLGAEALAANLRRAEDHFRSDAATLDEEIGLELDRLWARTKSDIKHWLDQGQPTDAENGRPDETEKSRENNPM